MSVSEKAKFDGISHLCCPHVAVITCTRKSLPGKQIIGGPVVRIRFAGS
jgi:hypothetical protein